MEQPWSSIPKTFYDQVTDCLTEAPGILERVAPLWHLSATQQLDLVYELVHECRHIDERLAIIHDEMLRAAPDPLYWSIPSDFTLIFGSDNPVTFPVIYWFSDLHCAATLILLWATRTMIWTGLYNLYSHVDNIMATKGSVFEAYETMAPQISGVEVVNPLPPLDRCTDILSMAHRVCRSVEFFLRDDMLLAGPLSIIPALGIVIDALKNQPSHAPEVAWLQEALEVVRQKGIRSLEHVK
ncbi:hypothetical protein N7448_001464 [Penicillium atrosanguineum]|uniref:Uncharacterized protein n=1 Tax=Penicillium atrosanguineum TaxID=1132637 RepID=A0A9W9HMD9_9EURO|nr:hypothetical protein N7526_004874 [Penicillium atrosanguineum]KAJ5149886.1 hypothetical protein N7448_001464 [Penicillium atrosanguineum]KAJ5324666.1 hypothetical protein N7476_003266 [Penicillium atrosanguineum]